MNLADVERVIGINLPKYFADYLYEFEKLYRKSYQKEDFLTEATLDSLIKQGFADANCKSDIQECAKKVKADANLDFSIKFLYYVICEKHRPWENSLFEAPAPESLGEYQYVFPLLLLLRVLQFGIENARNHGIDEEYLAQLKGVFSYATYDRQNNRWELRNIFGWHIKSAMGTMYQIGRIKFEPKVPEKKYLGLRRKSDGALLFVYRGEASIDEYGQFCRSGANVEFVTEYSEDANTIIANPIHPSGRILHQKVTLDKKEWQVEIDGGMALAMHIPSGSGYNATEIGKSYKMALEFYGKYFPDLKFSCFMSHSWLYSPQLVELLPYDSGINTFNRKVYICPFASDESGFYTFVFKTNNFDIETADTSTTLKKNFVEFIKSGRRANNGILFYPISMLNRFGEDIKYPLTKNNT